MPPVAVDPIAAVAGTFATYDRFACDTARLGTPAVECGACGFEPDGKPPTRCPKCGGSCWERYVRPGLVDGGIRQPVRPTHRRAWRGVIRAKNH